MPSRFKDYRVKRGDDLGNPEYWNRRLKDVDARIAANEEQRSSLEEVIEEGRVVFREKANDVLLPLIQEVNEIANLGVMLRATSATEHQPTIGGKTFVIDEGQRLRFAPPAYVAVYRMESPQAAMLGEVVSWDTGTGELVVDVDRVSGAGDGGGWTITAASPSDTAEAIAEVLAARTATEAMRDQVATARDESQTFLSDAELAKGEAEAFATAASDDADRSEGAIGTLETIFGQQSQLYLGSAASDPIVDLNGDPLVAGAEYWNTVSGVKKIHDGAGWTVSYVPVGSEVTTVYGRSGNVVAQLGDYSADKVSRTDGAGGVAGDTVESALAALLASMNSGLATKVNAATYTAGLAAKADKAITLSGGGLATGGGDLSANRTITVPKATQAQAEAGLDDLAAMTSLATRHAINALVPAATDATAGKVRFATTGDSQTATTIAVNPALLKQRIDEAIAALLDGAPGAIDTLNELAAALGDDPNFATTVNNAIAQKLNTSAVSSFVLGNLLGAANAGAFRSALGLGTAATQDAGAFLATGGTAQNAHLLDGFDHTYFLNASNLNAGTLPAARFADTSHGARAGGGLHAVATPAIAGFMSAADKAKMDTLSALPTRLYGNSLQVADWNAAVENGWYMAAGAANAPGNSPDWFVGRVSAHNSIWLEQEAFHLTNTAHERWRRYCENGSWTSWKRAEAGFELIDRVDIGAGISFVDFVDLAAYHHLKVVLRGGAYISTHINYGILTSTDNGASFATSGYGGSIQSSGSALESSISDRLPLFRSSAFYIFDGAWDLTGFNDSSVETMLTGVAFGQYSSTRYQSTVTGRRLADEAHNAIRVDFGGGVTSHAEGTLDLYGMKG